MQVRLGYGLKNVKVLIGKRILKIENTDEATGWSRSDRNRRQTIFLLRNENLEQVLNLSLPTHQYESSQN